MGYRINERNIGNNTLDAKPKKKGKKLNIDEYGVVQVILERVYNAMKEDEITKTYTDGGRITISLTGEEMFDLFEAKRKIKEQFINQKIILK